jgi:hypothetical protein
MEALVCYYELAFLITHAIHEARVVSYFLAIGHGSTDTVVSYEGHVQCHVTDEGMFKYQCGTCLGKQSVNALDVSIAHRLGVRVVRYD